MEDITKGIDLLNLYLHFANVNYIVLFVSDQDFTHNQMTIERNLVNSFDGLTESVLPILCYKGQWREFTHLP